MAKRRKTGAQLLNEITSSALFTHYTNMALNMFKWEGLPEGIQERHIERVLFNEGKVLFFRDPAMSYMALPCFNGEELDVYGDPLHWRAMGLGYNHRYHRDDCVLIENNKLRAPTRDMVVMYVNKLYQASRTMDVNLSTAKAPFLVLCDEKRLLTYKEVLRKIDENEPAIFGTSGINPEAVQVLPTRAEFIGNELMDFHRSVEAQLLTYLGIDNCPVDKKERLVTDEARSNNQLISVNADLMLEARKRACEQINELYGLSVSVDLRNKPEGGDANVSDYATQGDNRENPGAP